MNPEIVFFISVGGRLMMIAALVAIGVYFLKKLSTVSDDE
jgi:flagellar biogenesis protein FliO